MYNYLIERYVKNLKDAKKMSFFIMDEKLFLKYKEIRKIIQSNLEREKFDSEPLFKGCLCYKMITSQNVSCEAQVKNFFILWKICILFSRYSSFCIFNHPLIHQICDILMSIST